MNGWDKKIRNDGPPRALVRSPRFGSVRRSDCRFRESVVCFCFWCREVPAGFSPERMEVSRPYGRGYFRRGHADQPTVSRRGVPESRGRNRRRNSGTWWNRQTRSTQNAVPKGVRVQVPPSLCKAVPLDASRQTRKTERHRTKMVKCRIKRRKRIPTAAYSCQGGFGVEIIVKKICQETEIPEKLGIRWGHRGEQPENEEYFRRIEAFQEDLFFSVQIGYADTFSRMEDLFPKGRSSVRWKKWCRSFHRCVHLWRFGRTERIRKKNRSRLSRMVKERFPSLCNYEKWRSE